MAYTQKGGSLGWKMGVGGGLEGFWDDVYNIANKVATGAQAVGQVTSGQKSIALVSSSSPSFVSPLPGSPFAVGAALPSWLLPVGLGVLAYVVMRKK